jgi:hypothetical protein
MAAKRPKKRIEQIRKARSKRAGSVKSRSQATPAVRWGKKDAAASRIVRRYKSVRGGEKRTSETRSQPRPKLPLLSGGKDPTLAERFEEELYRS